MKSVWPDPRFRELTPELLRSISADEIADAVLQHVELRRKETGNLAAVLAELPSGTRAIYTTYLVDAAVNNGGFHQFFFKAFGTLAGDALTGYELLGADRYADIMRAAIATFETERDRRQAYDEIDQRYFALGDGIAAVWATAVHDRPELFRTP
jgi:Domain of unknown function (DUF4375)